MKISKLLFLILILLSSLTSIFAQQKQTKSVNAFLTFTGIVINEDKSEGRGIDLVFINQNKEIKVTTSYDGGFRVNLSSGVYETKVYFCGDLIQIFPQVEVKKPKAPFRFVLNDTPHKRIICDFAYDIEPIQITEVKLLNKVTPRPKKNLKVNNRR